MTSVECPHCHHPIPRYRLFVTPAWGRFTCPGCGSILGIDLRRRLLATLPWIAILFVLLGVWRITSYGVWAAAPVIILMGFLNYAFLDRPVVHERCGFRCRACGYDLQGQVAPSEDGEPARCPECGAAFDMGEKAAMNARPKGASKRRALATVTVAIVFGLLTAGLLVGIMVQRRAATRAVLGIPRLPAQSAATDWEKTAWLAEQMERVHLAASGHYRDYGRWPESITPLIGRSLPSEYTLPPQLTYRPPPQVSGRPKPQRAYDPAPDSQSASSTSQTPSLTWILLVSDPVSHDLDGKRLTTPHRLILRLGGEPELLPAEQVEEMLSEGG